MKLFIMRRAYSYQKISRLYRRFQFHVSGFLLATAGVWIFWKISREPFIADWLLYLILLWAIALVIELIRFIYVFNRRTKNKNHQLNDQPDHLSK
jgi:hypothetical protein